MDNSVSGLLDLLTVMHGHTSVLICRGDRWRMESCKPPFLSLTTSFNISQFFVKNEIPAPFARPTSFLDVLFHHGGSNLAEMVRTSQPGTGLNISLPSGRWTLSWKWLDTERQDAEALRFILLSEVPHAENTDEMQLYAFMDSMPDGLWIIDGNGTTLHVNKALKRIANIEPGEMIGKSISIPLNEGKFATAVTLEALEQKKIVTRFDDYPNGTRCLNTSTPIFDTKGNISRVVACIRDITELEGLQKGLADAERTAYLHPEPNTYVPQDLEIELIAASKVMRRCTVELERAAKAPSGILILGETGTGKTFAASYIHQKSSRAHGPFVTVNCAAIPQTLIESELFGYERGAFTGANRSGRKGYFEMADKGTLLLDEIGELPLNMQAKILHVLDGQSFRKIGGEKELHVDVRIIAATNRPLEQIVNSGRFRADLYYRLRVLSICMPPLREHPEDIPALMMFFLDKACAHCKSIKTFSPKVVECFCKHSWPGNVRELQAAIEFLVAMTESSIISTRDLPSYLRGDVPLQDEEDQEQDDTAMDNASSFKDAIETLERTLISEALAETGSTYKAAAKLGISQSTVVRKAKQLRIPITEKRKAPD